MSGGTSGFSLRRPTRNPRCFILYAATSETFSPNAIGVGAIDALPTFAPTPMALGLNVECLIHGCVKHRMVGRRSKRAGPTRR